MLLSTTRDGEGCSPGTGFGFDASLKCIVGVKNCLFLRGRFPLLELRFRKKVQGGHMGASRLREGGERTLVMGNLVRKCWGIFVYS